MAYTDIDKPSDYFNTKLYTGNATDATGITGVGFQPDMTWIKERSQVRSHVLFDVIRGATVQLNPNDTASDATVAASLQSFNSDGFTVGTATSVNQNTDTYVSWNWKETATAGFDIVSYTGDGSEGRNISHSLSAVPAMMIIKNRSGTTNWIVYHHKNTSAPATEHLKLNLTDATADDDSTWDDTAPTSSVFRVKSSSSVNGDGSNYIAYLFAEKQGYSKFGSYVGNGNADGTFVYTGFSVGWVMIKNIDTGSTAWVIQDSKRSSSGGGNQADKRLRANASNAEETDSPVDLLSNGFKIRSTGSFTSDANTFIYMAFAENPFVTSTGVPATAR